MCNGLNEPNPGRCNGKCSDLGHRSAYQRGRGASLRAEAVQHVSPPVALMERGDTETPLSPQAIRDLLAAAWRPEGDGGGDPWEAIEAAERKRQAKAVLLEHFGDPVTAVTEAGHIIANHGEELAGITAGEAKEDWVHRKDAAEAAYNSHAASIPARLLAGQDLAVVLAHGVQLGKDLNAIHNGTDPESRRTLRKLADGYAAALAEVIPMGGTLKLDPDSDRDAAAALQAGARYFPAEWIEISNSGHPLYASINAAGGGAYGGRVRDEFAALRQGVDSFDFIPGRVPAEPSPHGEWVPTGHVYPSGVATYQRERWEVAEAGAVPPAGLATEYEQWVHPTTGEVRWRRPALEAQIVSKDTSVIYIGEIGPETVDGVGKYGAVAIHEQTHRYEATVGHIRQLEGKFLDSRTKLADGTREAARFYGDPEAGGGWVRPDHFASAYTGRDAYENGATEILSTGTEGLFGGQYGGHIGLNGFQPDLEMRAFVLGLMVTATGKTGES